MRILFVLEHFYPYIGGAEQLFYELSRSLAKEGHSIWVVTTRHDNSLPKQELIDGVQVLRIPCYNRFLFTFFSLPKIIQLARKCDYIHTTTYNAALPAWLGGRLLGKRVLITFHEVWGSLWWDLPFLRKWQKYLYFNFEALLLRLSFDHYVAVSDFTKKCLEGQRIASKKITRIYNGLDQSIFKHYQHKAPQEFTYTYFGRLGVSKGLDLLLPAADRFFQKYPKTHLQLIIPTYPNAIFSELKQQIRTRDLSQHIRLYHDLPKPKLFEMLCHSSCVVIPSYSEGFCFAAAEAVALEVPIISSQQGALREVVSGTFLEMDTLDADALFQALEKAYQQQWNHCERRAFSLEDTIRQHLALYQSLIPNNSKP